MKVEKEDRRHYQSAHPGGAEAKTCGAGTEGESQPFRRYREGDAIGRGDQRGEMVFLQHQKLLLEKLEDSQFSNIIPY